MYLVSPEYVSHRPPSAPPTPSPQQQPNAAMSSQNNAGDWKRKKKQHPYDKWVKMKRKIQVADILRQKLIKDFAALLQAVLPRSRTSAGPSMPPPVTPDVPAGLMSQAPDTASPSLPFLYRADESLFASPIKRSLSMESDEEETSYVPGEATVKAFSEQNFGAVASPYVATYVFRTGNVDKDFEMRRDVDGTFQIGNAEVLIDKNSNVIYMENHIRGQEAYLKF